MQKQDQTRNIAIIVAAGSGVRAGNQTGRPKQYCTIAGATVLRRTINAFASHPEIEAIQVVIRAGDEEFYWDSVKGVRAALLLPPVPGGETRQLSVANGLEAIAPHEPSAVLIHDAARPFVTADCISDTLAALEGHDGAIAAAPVTDTLKEGVEGRIARTVSREGLWRAQTPQTFRYARILEAHRAALRGGRRDFTDDASIAEWSGLSIALVETTSMNFKITTAEDLALADLIARGGSSIPDIRSGSGFDVHAFESGDHVTLCGVRIPHTHGLKGHSDADAGLHALTDALLGTIGAGDIGDHFPPSDPQWKGADSTIFLLRAAELVRERKGRIANVDLTLVCERPKIGPFREAMRKRIAELLHLDLDRVSIKATTSEGLGFTGRREGIAAFATVTVAFGEAIS